MADIRFSQFAFPIDEWGAAPLGPPVRPQFLNSVDTARHHVTRERRPPFPCDTIEDATSSSLIPHGAMMWHVVWCALDSVLSGCMWEDLCGPVPNHRAKCELRKRQFGVRWTACYPAACGRIYVAQCVGAISLY